jgi:ABC-type molybdate transport system ATPase subunit
VTRRIFGGTTTPAVMRLRLPSQAVLDKTKNLSLRNEGKRIGLIFRA